MTKDKKPAREPEPEPTRAEQDAKVDEARAEVEKILVQLATDSELSSAEMFWIVSSIIYKLSTTAKDAEQDEFFGPREEPK